MSKLITRSKSVSSLLLLGLLVGGCRDSNSDVRGDAALQRLRTRPKPGYVRFVNLGPDPLEVSLKSRRLYGTIPFGAWSQLTPIGAGKQSLKVGGNDLVLDVSTEVSGTNVRLASDKIETLWGDVRAPDSKGNVRVVLAKGDGSAKFPAKGVPLEGQAGTRFVKEAEVLSLTPGEYKFNAIEVKVEDHCAYTFLLVPYKGVLRAFLMKNTMNEKPVSSGMSSN